jgi:hypothetical protein
MGIRPSLGTGALALGSVLMLFTPACVDPYRGANIQLAFDDGVHTPAPTADDAIFGRPPPNTYYTFWAVRNIYDDDGNLEDAYFFRIQDFEIQPAINPASPCFIDLEGSRFPGLHVTQIAQKMREDTGVYDPYDPQYADDDPRVIDVLTADVRRGNLSRIRDGVKAVTSFSNAQYPYVDMDPDAPCVADPGSIPPPHCRDEESNRIRLALCTAFWRENPGFYEGSDKVYTLPLSAPYGEWYGAVSTRNPINDISSINGAAMFVDTILDDFDVLLMNWQYKDLDGDGQPDYPDDFPDESKSRIGFHYMSGVPRQEVRGVLYVSLRNRSFSSITGEAAIYPNLGKDDVRF